MSTLYSLQETGTPKWFKLQFSNSLTETSHFFIQNRACAQAMKFVYSQGKPVFQQLLLLSPHQIRHLLR